MSYMTMQFSCPKCNRKNSLSKVSKIWKCRDCAEEFTLDELVEEWGFDVGDFFDISFGGAKMGYSSNKVFLAKYSEFVGGEPHWISEWERGDDYRTVTKMILGIPELDDYADLKNMERDALQIGIQ